MECLYNNSRQGLTRAVIYGRGQILDELEDRRISGFFQNILKARQKRPSNFDGRFSKPRRQPSGITDLRVYPRISRNRLNWVHATRLWTFARFEFHSGSKWRLIRERSDLAWFLDSNSHLQRLFIRKCQRSNTPLELTKDFSPYRP